jgi:hypothetical protein
MRSPMSFRAPSQVSRGCATSSAAAVGVGARRSATKSAMVKSVSCPTPADHRHRDFERAMARASRSSLKAHRSSIEPPPRTSRITSIGRRCRIFQPNRPPVPLAPSCASRYNFDQRTAQGPRARRRPAPPPAPARTGMWGTRRCQGRQHVVQRRRAGRGDDADRRAAARAAGACGRRRTGPRPPVGPSGAGTARTARPARPAPWRLSTTSCRSPRASYTRQAPAHLHLVALARGEVQQAGGAAEHGAAQLARLVLESKSSSARWPRA